MKAYRAFQVLWGQDGEGGSPYLSAPAMHSYGPGLLEYPLVEATCTKHRAPQGNCSCGYYAYKVPGGAADYGRASGLMTEINLYGRIMEHLHGYRSQHLQVIILYHPHCTRGDCEKQAVWALRGGFENMEGDAVRRLYGWLEPLAFCCDEHKPEPIVRRQQPAPNGLALEYEAVVEPQNKRLVEIGLVMNGLSQKLRASVYPFEATVELLGKQYMEFQRRLRTVTMEDVMEEIEEELSDEEKAALEQERMEAERLGRMRDFESRRHRAKYKGANERAEALRPLGI